MLVKLLIGFAIRKIKQALLNKTAQKRLVEYVNKKVDLPYLTEADEEKVIEAVIEGLELVLLQKKV